MKKLWTIAVLTIPGREQLLNRLLARLKPQLNDQVRVEVFEHPTDSIGNKRQRALMTCKTSYISFIDDDDLVSPQYVNHILSKMKYLPDGIGFRGIITSNNIKPVEFVHRAGLNYIDKVFRSSDCYIFHRPLNHLNPVKVEIARKIGYNDSNHGEDKDYALRLAESGLITDDVFIDEFLYFYQYRIKNVKV
jgi:cellulose synthase/poly-beta-1,6-N-acetylglucosamine synthase-like glycosyltransferase